MEPEQNEQKQGPHDPSQEHPPQEAHGGSMAPDLVDDAGHEKPEEPEE